MPTEDNYSDTCRLCGSGLHSPGVEDDEGISFCSTGCQDVHSTLGVADASERETTPGAEHTEGADENNATNSSHKSFSEGVSHTFFRIDGMYSATCESYLETVAEKNEGVIDAKASYVTESIRVVHDPEQISETSLREALSTLGYTAYVRQQKSTSTRGSENQTRRVNETEGMQIRPDDEILEFRYAVGLLFGAFLMLPYAAIIYPVHLASLVDLALLDILDGAFELSSPGAVFLLRIYLIMAGVIIIVSGLPVLRGAYISLKMRQPNTDLLVATTILSAYVYSAVSTLLQRSDIFFDITIVVAATVTATVFYESSIKQRALGQLTDLTVSQVDTAKMYDDGVTKEVPIEDLSPGDRVLVRQGERIPVDGELLDGSCTVDEAVVTGESLPVLKKAGDAVIGGSIVTDDAAVVQVGDSTTSSIDRITTAVWDLQTADHGVQRHADQLASWFIAILVPAAIVVPVVALLFGTPTVQLLLLFFLVLLVGSPWALGLATPLSVATSLQEALQKGIVIFDETVFERLRDVDVVVFDKTGTLTTGDMDVVESDAPPELLEMAARLENRASHPAANAIVTAFARDEENTANSKHSGDSDAGNQTGDGVAEFTSYASGIAGVVDGEQILVGNLDIFTEQGWKVSENLQSRVDDARGFGRLPVIVGRDGTAEGIIVVGDEPRDGWDEAISRLGKAGKKIVLLTGDDEEAVEFFSQHEHVTHVFANVPPDGKTATIRRLKSDGQVAMVGDGTNDAPALATADLGISLGSGTALAADAADIAITDDTITSVETTFNLASTARQRMRQNNAFALIYNAIAISAVAVGLFNPLIAGIAIITSGGLIAINSSRKLVQS